MWSKLAATLTIFATILAVLCADQLSPHQQKEVSQISDQAAEKFYLRNNGPPGLLYGFRFSNIIRSGLPSYNITAQALVKLENGALTRGSCEVHGISFGDVASHTETVCPFLDL